MVKKGSIQKNEYVNLKFELQKIMKSSLKDANWRLMSDGVSYRLGILTSRLRAYEKEEDLLKLVRQNDTK